MSTFASLEEDKKKLMSERDSILTKNKYFINSNANLENNLSVLKTKLNKTNLSLQRIIWGNQNLRLFGCLRKCAKCLQLQQLLLQVALSANWLNLKLQTKVLPIAITFATSGTFRCLIAIEVANKVLAIATIFTASGFFDRLVANEQNFATATVTTCILAVITVTRIVLHFFSPLWKQWLYY